MYMYFQTSTLKSATDNLEEKEQKLVNDCVQQLGKYKSKYSFQYFLNEFFPKVLMRLCKYIFLDKYN